MTQLFKEYYEDMKNEGSSGSGNVEVDTRAVQIEIRPANGFFPTMDRDFARMLVAEMFGTFLLLFAASGILAAARLSNGRVGLMEYALTGGFSIIVIMFCIGYISGAHINPSITVALATVGQFPWCKVPFYVGVQLGASVMAAYVGKIVYDMPCDLAVTEPLGGIMRAFIAEFIATLFIMFLVSAIISNIHSIGWSSAFGFGAAVSLAVLITGPVSGGSLNPARSFGPAIISERFEDLWLYFVAPTVGSIVGAFLFRLLQLEQQTLLSLSASSSPTPQSFGELRV